MATLNCNQLESYMDGMLVNDTRTMKLAEENLRKALRTQDCVEPLWMLIQNSQKTHVRQMGALFLWRRINKFWNGLTNVHELIKDGLIQCLQHEKEVKVRKAICCIIAALAKHLLPGNQWPNLLTFLDQACNSTNAVYREIGYLLFFTLSETIAACMEEQFNYIINLFIKGLNDTELPVRIMASKAAGSLLMNRIEEGEMDFTIFQPMLRPMLITVHHAVESGDEACAVSAFDVLGELLDTPQDVPVMNEVIKDLIALCLSCAMNESLEDGTRRAVLQVISALCRTKPRFLCSIPDCVSSIINTLLTIMSKEDIEDDSSMYTVPGSL